MVVDAVYNPRRTRLLQEADSAGCRAVEGLEMFLGNDQGIAVAFAFAPLFSQPFPAMLRSLVRNQFSYHLSFIINGRKPLGHQG